MFQIIWNEWDTNPAENRFHIEASNLGGFANVRQFHEIFTESVQFTRPTLKKTLDEEE